MSYYTRLELDWDDSDHPKGSLTANEIAEAAREYARASDWGIDDVLADLRESASGNGLDHPGYNRITPSGLIEMLATISRTFPQVTFYARGIGEEYFETWARHLRAGQILWEFGPFEPEA
jgi:hypothetical protein